MRVVPKAGVPTQGEHVLYTCRAASRIPPHEDEGLLNFPLQSVT